ncbi:MAG TPA: preprotein translocase subunit YajC [Acidimicrobiales bacterium]|nr:preprotein translocase subunit YajC [Acidimicrobiales bacterium]
MVSTAAIFPHLVLFAATSKKSSSGSSAFIFVLLIAFIGIYFLWLRPQRNRLRQQQSQNRDAAVGDEVVTTSGIVGRVLSIDGDRVTIETGHGHTMTLMRSAIARRIDPNVEEPPLPDYDNEADDDAAEGGTESDGTTDQQWWPDGDKGHPGEGGEGGPS